MAAAEEKVNVDAHNTPNKDVTEEQYVVDDIPEMKDDDLIFEMYYLQCLAQGSYLVATKSEGIAYIVDPRRDVDFYMGRLQTLNDKYKINLQLRGILMTHAHADFVAGNVELSNRINTDSNLKLTDKNACHSYFGDQVGTKVDHIPVNDNYKPLYVSKNYQIRPLHTPGHTLGCITWLLEQKGDNNNYAPVKAFTGDTLFIGSVGRPDLVSSPADSNKSPDEMRKIMATKMFHSLTEKIFDQQNGLPNECHVHPAHGAGSPCGSNLSDAMYSTIKTERDENIAYKKTFEGENKFVEWLVGTSANIEQGTPQYFEACVKANLTGVETVENATNNLHKKIYDSNKFSEILLEIEKNEQKNNDLPIFIIDTRESDKYNQGFIKNSLNFPVGPQKGTVLRKIDGNFAIWLGTLLPQKSNIFLIPCNNDMIDDNIVRFARINYDKSIQGILKDGINDWIKNNKPIIKLERFSLKNLSLENANNKLKNAIDGYIFIDVRTQHEYNESHVKNAINLTLSVNIFNDENLKSIGLNKNNKYIAYCSGGFRSTIASSILRYKGFNVIDVSGGYDLGLAPWIDQDKYLTGSHGLCNMSKKWAIKLGFQIPSLMAELQQEQEQQQQKQKPQEN